VLERRRRVALHEEREDPLEVGKRTLVENDHSILRALGRIAVSPRARLER
jgi:hypothetical protein